MHFIFFNHSFKYFHLFLIFICLDCGSFIIYFFGCLICICYFINVILLYFALIHQFFFNCQIKIRFLQYFILTTYWLHRYSSKVNLWYFEYLITILNCSNKNKYYQRGCKKVCMCSMNHPLDIRYNQKFINLGNKDKCFFSIF